MFARSLAPWASSCARWSRRGGSWPGWNSRPICARPDNCSIAWLAAIVLAIAALPVLVVCLADVLDGRAGIHRGGWLLIFGGGLLLLAVAGGYLAWRRFRRKFVGLRETLEELREDMLWLQEKSGRE